MTKSIYVTSATRGSGKTTICLGLVNALERTLGRVAFFKPISNTKARDVTNDAELIKESMSLSCDLEDMAPVSKEEVVDALANGTFDSILDKILEAYTRIAAKADFIVIEGTDYAGAMSTFEFNINADIAKNLGAPTILVADAADAFETSSVGKVRDPKAIDRMLKNIRMVAENLRDKGCELIGLVMNRANPIAAAAIQSVALEKLEEMGVQILGTIPREDDLNKPTLAEIARCVAARVTSGETRLDVVAQHILVAAMSLEGVLMRIKRGTLIIVPGDRGDLLIGLASAYRSASIPTPCGLVLTGGLQPSKFVGRLFQDLTKGEMPILEVRTDTYETAVQVSSTPTALAPNQDRRIETVKALVEKNLDLSPIIALADRTHKTSRLTPKQFTYRIIELARERKQHIVLPEGIEERVLRAADSVLARDIANITLLGREADILCRKDALGLKLQNVHIVDPTTSPWRESFAKEYQRLRAHKSPTWDHAWDLMGDNSYFGTMMVQLGFADGMVSGSITTTAATLRPALEFVKTKAGYSIASSVFFMCLPDSVLVYGDCAVNPNPTATQLADIALASAETAAAFGVEPRVAMLSYSTGSSGFGSDVEKVREATKIVRTRNPEVLIEGPIQYDAAIDPSVAKTKLPLSEVAGRATVFIFPDLNAGNNTYKAVQRAAKAIAVGPVMQGLNKPVNDLSRGCTVADIFNTVAITAVQAQGR